MRKNPHMGSVLEVLSEIHGVVVRQTLGQDIVLTAFLPKRLGRDEVFYGICHEVKRSGVELAQPTTTALRRRLTADKKPSVVTVKAVAGKETPPLLNVWFRLPNEGDHAHRQTATAAELHRRFYGIDDEDVVSTPSLVDRVVGNLVVPALSRISIVQKHIFG